MNKVFKKVQKVFEKALKKAFRTIKRQLWDMPEQLVERAPKPKVKSVAKTTKKKPSGKKK
jgi:hypothetical protein